MLKSYLTIAWRNMMKNKVFSFINVFGLAVGFTCCMLISLYLYNELTYDRQFKDSERIYQLGTTFIRPGQTLSADDNRANTPAPMARMMQAEFPEIEKSTRLLKAFSDDKTLLQYTEGSGDTRSFYETRGYLADSNFFQLFNFHFTEGDPSHPLTEPNTVVLSTEIAEKFFGKQPALDKIIHISSSTNGDKDYRITGVFDPGTKPTHLDARFFMSMKGGRVDSFLASRTDLASNNMFFTYFLLHPGTDPQRLEAKFPAFIDKYAGKDLKAMGFQKKQYLINLRDIHLDSKTPQNVTPPASVNYLYILASIAVFILLIACINFMNLSTARSSRRSAEVGVRKVLGAERSGLVRQFLGESVLFALIAFLFAIAFTALLLPLFGKLSGRDLQFSLTARLPLVFGFIALAVITGFIAGSYPAFYLSSFKPVRVLKGKFTNSFAAVSLRKSLVVLQFVISVVLIIASVVIAAQMKYMRSKDLGFAKDQQIVIPMRSDPAKAIYTSLKNELSSSPDITSVGAALYYPGIMNPSDMPLYKEGKSMNEMKRVYMNWVDESFLQTLDIKPVAGRVFSKDFPADTNFRMVLNEQTIRDLEFKSPQEAVGKRVLVDWQGETYRFEVIGVVKDFHFKDLHSTIEPYGFQLNNIPQYNYAVAHIKPGAVASALHAIEKAWHNLNPNEPFEYSFLDEDFAKNYIAETRTAGLVNYFTIIAILISCLGLFGLASFSAEQRTKEIGIRKVLGASMTDIVGLLSTDFLKLVLVAVVVASPIAWWGMNRWLRDFAYRVGIGWWVFAMAALLALLIAFLTISFQAVKAARNNPVKNLRTE